MTVPFMLSNSARKMALSIVSPRFTELPGKVLVHLPILPFNVCPKDLRMIAHAMLLAADEADRSQCEFDANLHKEPPVCR